ncbi:phosphotransferase family protein [Pullulanibacillus sp. KACC 23026]|uniref:phosphotransferase family protein n=1 Tax=Pullulanibacillus sp. KACC 23026 TaxID=3028315 RepID=UPI0023B1AD72|nr:phosphotransferase family protein [Pullulanibacillus sp. KACC 23026]WEG13857.1 phosphotransferase family protein [Pullulanibacillus sp. KACC 23026]
MFDNEDWVITSAGGVTGEAYLAQSEQKKLFLKRNSSPFLAVLSAEGIVPKLLWTKRLENGDVISAQRWLEGRELKAHEMKSERVAKLLKKIHQSEPLVFMLARLGKEAVTPQHFLNNIMDKAVSFNDWVPIKQALAFLTRTKEKVKTHYKRVCHSDINHNNWLLDEDDQLYLVDWDQAIIADPALDLALILYWYIDEADWESWLKGYGWTLTPDLQLRMHWYMVAQTLIFFFYHYPRNKKEAEFYLNNLIHYNQHSSRF